MVGAVKPSQGFLRTSWHPPRPPKHDGWESWRVWIIWGQWKKREEAGPLLCMRTLGCSHRIVCCFVIQPQASGQGIQPRWSQCLYPERPLRTAVLWRSMSSLCVSIKIRQFGWKAVMRQATVCFVLWVGKVETRHAPNAGVKDVACLYGWTGTVWYLFLVLYVLCNNKTSDVVD